MNKPRENYTDGQASINLHDLPYQVAKKICLLMTWYLFCRQMIIFLVVGIRVYCFCKILFSGGTRTSSSSIDHEKPCLNLIAIRYQFVDTALSVYVYYMVKLCYKRWIFSTSNMR